MQIVRGRRRTVQRELIAADPGSSFRAQRFTSTHWELTWHAHPEVELTWIERGSGLRYIGDTVSPFAAGDLVLLGPQVPHSWSSVPRAQRTVCASVVQFSPDLIAGAEQRVFADLIRRSLQGLVIRGACAVAVRAQLTALFALPPGLERLGRLLTALGLIAAARGEEVGPIARHLPALPTSGPWAAVVKDLHEQADQFVSVAVLARRHGLSPSSFARGFRRRFGLTCGDYLARVRLARVARDLLESDRAIAEIAFAAGFGTLAAFNRRFKAVHGLTPRAFRARQRGT